MAKKKQTDKECPTCGGRGSYEVMTPCGCFKLACGKCLDGPMTFEELPKEVEKK